MPRFPRNAIAGSILALATAATLALSANANAQASHPPIHHKIHAVASHRPDMSPLAPGVELHASTSTWPGSENHYFSDTVASGHSDFMDPTFRYGQSPSTRYNDDDPLFRF
jgi:hypothetical protein